MTVPPADQDPLLDPSVDPDEEPEELDPTLFEMQASFCRTMGHPHRLMILYVLKEREMCVSDIAARLQISQPSISQHLAAMRGVGMVAMQRKGQFVYYRLADDSISQACEMVRGILTRRVHERSAMLGGKG